MANVFNNFFVSVSTQVCSEIPRTKTSPLDYLKNRNMNSFISPVTHSEIEDMIISLKNGKSTGPFSIPVKLPKLIKSDISRSLACIFNESINLGIFLINSNVQTLSPFIRKELTLIHQIIDQAPYFSVLSKLFEKLMFKRLYEYLDNLNTFYPLQFEFREKTQPIMH